MKTADVATMNTPSQLFTLCTVELWNAHPKMNNGPNSLRCLYCIKSLLKIRETYESAKSILQPFLPYHVENKCVMDYSNEFEIITITTASKNIIKTFMIYHILYQMNIFKRIILPDYYYRIGFAIINSEGIKTKKYNSI